MRRHWLHRKPSHSILNGDNRPRAMETYSRTEMFGPDHRTLIEGRPTALCLYISYTS